MARAGGWPNRYLGQWPGPPGGALTWGYAGAGLGCRVSPGASHTPAYVEVDLTTCDREPIHVPGAIQPHGVLLALDAERTVVMASENVGVLLGSPPEQALGSGLADLLGPEAAELAAARIADWIPAEPLVVTLPEGLAGRLA